MIQYITSRRSWDWLAGTRRLGLKAFSVHRRRNHFGTADPPRNIKAGNIFLFRLPVGIFFFRLIHEDHSFASIHSVLSFCDLYSIRCNHFLQAPPAVFIHSFYPVFSFFHSFILFYKWERFLSMYMEIENDSSFTISDHHCFLWKYFHCYSHFIIKRIIILCFEMQWFFADFLWNLFLYSAKVTTYYISCFVLLILFRSGFIHAF